MRIEEIREIKDKLYQIAVKHNISKIFLFGSVVRGENSENSDIDFLLELEPGASALGIAGFQYEAQELLGIEIDVIPAFALAKVEDLEFVKNIQAEAVAL